MYAASVCRMDTKEQARQRVAAYINVIAGKKTAHATIANYVNDEIDDARFAGPLIGRWRKGEVDISPGNLAAFARAYKRNPLEAFVAACLLEIEEVENGLDEESLELLGSLEGWSVSSTETTTSKSRTSKNPKRHR